MSLILDDVPNAYIAYSTRKLRADYAGAAVKVKESGGNTELDIGFDANGELDEDAILAHCGANDGFVTRWYDQSGNGQDVIQATALNQPRIATAGAVVKNSNGVALVDCLEISTTGLNEAVGLIAQVAGPRTAYVAMDQPATSITSQWNYLIDIESSRHIAFAKGDTNGEVQLWGSTKIAAAVGVTGEQVLTFLFENPTARIYRDGGEIANGAYTEGAVTAGTQLGISNSYEPFTDNSSECLISEIIMWSEGHDSSTRSTVESWLGSATPPVGGGGGGGAASKFPRRFLSSFPRRPQNLIGRN